MRSDLAIPLLVIFPTLAISYLAFSYSEPDEFVGAPTSREEVWPLPAMTVKNGDARKDSFRVIMADGHPVYISPSSALRGSKSVNNGLQRGKAMAEVMGGGADSDTHQLIKDAWARLSDTLAKDDEGAQANSAIELIFNEVVTANLKGGVQHSGWIPDLVQETQGLSRGIVGLSAGELQRLLISSEIGSIVESHGAALKVGGECVLLGLIQSQVYDLSRVSVPLVAVHGDRAALMICPFGVSLPLASVNTQGLALIRGAPTLSARDYQVSRGPDLLTEARVFALYGDSPGFAAAKDGMGVGRTLLNLNESPSLLTRLASPGILLASGKGETFRYEWRAAGGVAGGAGLEFETLGDQDPLLTCGPTYRSVELAEGKAPAANHWETELALLRGGDPSEPSIVTLLSGAPEGSLALALWPKRQECWYRAADGKVIRLSLKALLSKWRRTLKS